MTDLAALIPYCAEGQRRIVEGLIEYGSIQKAADGLKINPRTISRALRAVRQKAALQGYSPEHDMTRTVPDGFKVRGVSTYYNDEGKAIGQWVKSSADDERRIEMLREAVDAMTDGLNPYQAIKSPKKTDADLCNVYTLTDCHVGMLAWHKEGGNDWDLDIAERTLTGAFSAMLEASQDADSCVIAQLGDWMHFDGLEAVTPSHRHLLDADGRFGKVVKASIRILRRVIDAALKKHKRVTLLIAEGNHDLASSIWMRNLFAALYEKNKRLTVIDSELPYYVLQHGNTMLAWHHGHLKKNEGLPLLMAAQFSEMWGATTKRYCQVGHRHHLDIKEHSGMTIVQHSTLSARDAYAARGGWMSERQARAITYHRQYGEVATVVITPEMLK